MSEDKTTAPDDAPEDEQKTSDDGGNAASGDQNQDGEAGENEQSSDGEDDVIKVARTSTNPYLLTQLEYRRLHQQARGLGAGGTGAAIFRAQRLTALGLIPLTIWFAICIVRLSTATQAEAAQWLAFPVHAVLMALFIVITLRHGVIGVQIVLEDYVSEGLRTGCVLLVNTFAVVMGAASVAALIRLLVA